MSRAADRRRLFPDAWKSGQEQRVAETWSFDYPLPVPQRPLVCPCGGQRVIRTWRFFLRAAGGSTAPWRCDVSMKCVACSLVTTHGVAIPREVYAAAHTAGVTDGTVEWRRGRRVLDQHGFFNSIERADQ